MSVTDPALASLPIATDVVLAIRGLSKDYGPVRVVNDIHLDVRRGEIHALLGENGAGKSTLIKMLAGVVSPSDGYIEVDGVRQRPRNVKEAQGLGIVALPQELTLVPGLSVADNIFLGLPQSTVAGAIKRRELDQRAEQQLQRLGQQLPLHTPVGELSAVQQTMVALARALARDTSVLVLDEPTAALTDTETEQLFTVLARLRAEGTAIIYVSHRLEEVFRLADVATVMRNGSQVWTKRITDTSPDDVVAGMIGRAQGQVFPARAIDSGVDILRLDNVSGYRVKGISLTAATGRVLGVAGLAGAGRSELLRIISGAQRAATGTVTFDGVRLGQGSVARAMAAGVVLVPEERRTQGLMLSASIQDNIALANLAELSRFGLASGRRERQTAETKMRELRIKATSAQQPVAELSGGNQQKVVLAKYLERRPRLLLLDEPTRGIDVGTKAEIYGLIRKLAEGGVAVVVVSSEIPELLGIADDIAVLHEGRLTGILPAAQTDEQTLLQYCYRRLEQ
jgi:ABC-type sugar transport system ATPase subunit